MNELTFILAVLVTKEVLTITEAAAIHKASKESIISSNLGEMIAKVTKALEPSPDTGAIEKVDARSIIGL